MFFSKDNIKYRVEQLEKRMDEMDSRYAIKLVERVVWGILAVAGTTAIGAWVTSVLGMFS